MTTMAKMSSDVDYDYQEAGDTAYDTYVDTEQARAVQGFLEDWGPELSREEFIEQWREEQNG